MHDIESLRFNGMVRGAFEDLTGASLIGEEADLFVDDLGKRYVAEGSPKARKKWIESVLREQVYSIHEMPKWIESLKPRWPFCNRKPMLFLGTFPIPDTPVAKTTVNTAVTLFLFAGKIPVKEVTDCWMMTYATVEQLHDL